MWAIAIIDTGHSGGKVIKTETVSGRAELADRLGDLSFQIEQKRLKWDIMFHRIETH